MKESYLSVDKIPEKSSRENLVKLRAQCQQIYNLFKVSVPFLYLLKTSGWNGLKSYILGTNPTCYFEGQLFVNDTYFSECFRLLKFGCLMRNKKMYFLTLVLSFTTISYVLLFFERQLPVEPVLVTCFKTSVLICEQFEG